MSTPIDVLIVEDSEADSVLLERELRRGGLEPHCKRVDSSDGFREALRKCEWDVVLSDYTLPGFSAGDALKLLNDGGYGMPFIVISGVARTSDVVSLLQSGARDFIEKDDLGRLVPAIRRSLQLRDQNRALLNAQEAARASEERYRRLVDLSPDGILVHSDGVISYANAALAEMLGAGSPEDLVGRPSLDFVPEKDRPTVLARRAQAAGGEPLKYRETQYRRMDGTLVDVERAVAAIDWQGHPSFLVIARDITQRNRAAEELREREAMMRRITDGVPAIIGYSDREGTLRFANRWYVEWFGKRPEEIIGERTADVLGPEAYQRTEPYRRKALAGEEVTFEGVRQIANTARPYRATFIPHRDASGKVQGYFVLMLDVSEHRRMEEALREQEAMLRRITDGVPAMISYVEKDGTIRFVNRRYADWFGWERESLIGANIKEVRGKEAHEANKEHRDRVYRWGEEATYEGDRVVRGILKRYQATLMPHFDDAGEVQGHFSLVLDITEQKRIEAALRESEDRFRAFFDNSPASMYVLDTEGRFTLANAEFLRRFDVTEDEITGKTGSDLQPPEIADQYAEMNEEVLREDRTVSRVIDQVYPDGTPRSNLSIKFPIRNVDGKPVGVGSINSNISDILRVQRALRESEAKFRGLVDGSLQGILIHADGKAKYVNAEFSHLFGVTEKEALAMPSIHALIHPDDRDRLVRYSRDRPAGRTVPALYEFRGSHKSGKILSFYAKASMIEWDGEAANYVALVDVTEQKHIEAQLQQSQKMEAVGQLTGGIAHDFNNLLTVILGNLQLAQKAESDPRRFLETAIGAVRRGADLTQRLLTFSRRRQLAPVAANVNALVEGMKTMLERTLGAQIEIVTLLDSAARPAMIDAAQLENAILNIGLNARDAMPDGGTLRIETSEYRLEDSNAPPWPDAPAGDYVILDISDTGSGMTPEIRSHAFEPFFTTKDVGEGTGLGLSMVYGFAKQSGGHVELDGAPGGGTRVRLYLPAADGEATKPAREDALPPVEAGSETVLVVEDDPEVRVLVTDMLKSLGYSVVEAADGNSGLGILGEGAPVDLLLTDVVLPGEMNGRMVAEEARKLNPDLKILFTSGYAENILFINGRMDSDICFLPKPYTMQSLSRAVRGALEK